MDLREKKTKKNIKNAFLQLRAHKPLERISVKELAELAEIIKATFYLHYHDIYDLSDCLQKELIHNILNDITPPDLLISDVNQINTYLFHAFNSYQSLIDILFSGSQASVLSDYLEKAIKDHIFQLLPEKRNDARFNILLTYQIKGSYYAYNENHKQFGIKRVLEILDETFHMSNFHSNNL